MWARTIELTLGCWLIISPFIFGHPPTWSTVWFNDMACGFGVALVALLSYAPSLRYLHLLTAGVALWLVLFGYFYQPYPAPPALQNNILVGLLLLMFAIVPTESNLPPPSWRDAAPTTGMEGKRSAEP